MASLITAPLVNGEMTTVRGELGQHDILITALQHAGEPLAETHQPPAASAQWVVEARSARAIAIPLVTETAPRADWTSCWITTG